jgi:hypothetical protein
MWMAYLLSKQIMYDKYYRCLDICIYLYQAENCFADQTTYFRFQLTCPQNGCNE